MILLILMHSFHKFVNFITASLNYEGLSLGLLGLFNYFIYLQEHQWGYIIMNVH